MPDLIHSKNKNPARKSAPDFLRIFACIGGDRKNIMVNQQGSKNFSDSVKK